MHQLHVQHIDGSTLYLFSRIFLFTLRQGIQYKFVRIDSNIGDTDNPIHSVSLINWLDESTFHPMEELNIGKGIGESDSQVLGWWSPK